MILELLNALGGVALILFGVRFLRKGLGKMVGPRLPVWIGRVTHGPIRAALSGVAAGMLAPSTSSQGLLAVSLIRDGTLELRRGFILLMGAYLGATLLLHIVALDLGSYAPIGILVGVVLFQAMRSRTLRGVGQVLLSISFVLLGVQIIGGIAGGLSESQDMRDIVRIVESYPFLAALFAACIAALVQSSTATLAIFIGFALFDETLATDKLVLEVVVGANIGITVAALIYGWADVPARRFSLGILILRAGIGIGVLFAANPIAEMMSTLAGSTAQRGALMHSAFNLLALLVMMASAGPLERLATRLVSSPPEDPMGPSPLDDRWADVPGMAFTQTKREIGLASRLTASMLNDAWSALQKRDAKLLDAVRRRDDKVDLFNRNVRRFLTVQLTDDLDSEETRRRFFQLRYMGDLESIADVIDKNLGEIVEKVDRRGLWFGDEEWDELRAVFRLAHDGLELSGAVFLEERPVMAKQLLALKQRVRDEELRLREKHYERLQNGDQSAMETADLYVDLLGELKHIVHLAAGVAHGVLELAQRAPASQRAATARTHLEGMDSGLGE